MDIRSQTARRSPSTHDPTDCRGKAVPNVGETAALRLHWLCTGETMNTTATTDKSVRAAVFSTIETARKAVDLLLAAGFRRDEITVVCSDETKERHFRAFEHQQPAGQNMPIAAAAGGAVGATLFGLTAVAASMATGGVPLAIAGGWAIMTGGVAGSFLGAMLTRGFEKEAANYYDQAVARGKILVAVEVHEPDSVHRLVQAQDILARAGAEPVSLPAG